MNSYRQTNTHFKCYNAARNKLLPQTSLPASCCRPHTHCTRCAAHLVTNRVLLKAHAADDPAAILLPRAPVPRQRPRQPDRGRRARRHSHSAAPAAALRGGRCFRGRPRARLRRCLRACHATRTRAQSVRDFERARHRCQRCCRRPTADQAPHQRRTQPKLGTRVSHSRARALSGAGLAHGRHAGKCRASPAASWVGGSPGARESTAWPGLGGGAGWMWVGRAASAASDRRCRGCPWPGSSSDASSS